MQLVWGHMEMLLSKEEQDEGAAARRAEEEEMLRGGSDDYAIEPAGCIDNVHPSTITCVRLAPGGDAVLTGAGVRTCLSLLCTCKAAVSKTQHAISKLAFLFCTQPT